MGLKSVQDGIFISFEGGEGVGKSTQIRRLAERLKQKGYQVVLTREPGGSAGAEAVRHILLSGAAQPFGVGMEVLLFSGARNDHVEAVIKPALAQGKVVLCDRFMDSSRVYQGTAGGLTRPFISAVERIAVDGVLPDRTLILDLDTIEGLKRVSRRSSQTAGPAAPDRFEKDDVTVHENRRQAFLEIARREPERCKVIDAGLNADAVAESVWDAVLPLLDRRAAFSGGER
ncbi:dTMP kinase [Martelella mediterranea]|uniref:Thymidylate kinase n=1 Tax=Martelella mediterranea TaxID=293089 RepID=A0A4R3NGY3_9HYPH|nr:dTMP kinase [Martelella mediterranea]TCT30241.1 thymidylate kinase [Martelella mediterranea]